MLFDLCRVVRLSAALRTPRAPHNGKSPDVAMECGRKSFLAMCATAVVAVLTIISFERRLRLVDHGRSDGHSGSAGVLIPRHGPQKYHGHTLHVLDSRIDPSKRAESIRRYYEMNHKDKAAAKDSAAPPGAQRHRAKVLLFTTDSMKGYSTRGNVPAGEIRMRWSLAIALGDLGAVVDTATTEEEFRWLAEQHAAYSAYILDPWTWAGSSRQPREFLQGREDSVYILDYFGRASFPSDGVQVDMKHVLTAFPLPAKNTFIGYGVEQPLARDKKTQGVFLGKLHEYSPRYRMETLKAIADKVKIVTTISPGETLLSHPNIEFLGHKTPEEFDQLLATSRFLITFGDTLNEPSAVDAVANGCVYINTVYNKPRSMNADLTRGDYGVAYRSEHPYLGERVGPPYVCTAREGELDDYMHCVDEAMRVGPLDPFVPHPFTDSAYRQRISTVFENVLGKA
eukprot:scaffold8_cov249-Pinguiococcus_pyrenoidosus.AAC.28